MVAHSPPEQDREKRRFDSGSSPACSMIHKCYVLGVVGLHDAAPMRRGGLRIHRTRPSPHSVERARLGFSPSEALVATGKGGFLFPRRTVWIAVRKSTQSL